MCVPMYVVICLALHVVAVVAMTLSFAILHFINIVCTGHHADP